MNTFRFSREPLNPDALARTLRDPACGGYASFEGWVRNHNEGLDVHRLEYEAFEPLAMKEAERIMAEAVEQFGIEHAACVHRTGDLAIGDLAVWVGASARHRHEAFVACRYIIDEVKHRVPIWKKEHYTNGDSGWVNCERCAAPSALAPDHAHEHQHQHSEHGVPAPAHGAHLYKPIPKVVPDYSRQMALKEVGAAGQARLRSSSVLVIGCGGLGVPVLQYLAGAGLGRIGLVDGDRLEPSNLHRQTLYALADVGEAKAVLAAARLRALNPDVDSRAHVMRLTAENAEDLVSQHDLVIDCTDNFSTKFLLNDVCVRLGKPVIFSSVYQYEGQLQVVRPDRGGACLRCVWPEATRDGLVGNCSEAGVLGPVPGVFGCLQALEALKTLLDLPGQLGDELLVLDLLTLSISRVNIRRAEACPDHAGARVHRVPTISVAALPSLEVDFDSLDDAAASGLSVIDIREPRELEETPAPSGSARHLPMAQLLHGNPALASGGKYLLVCASGRRSLAAAEELRTRGFDEVYSLRGGVAGLARRSLS
jgi:sulfur-carrier protein adenylyltransferase/sulfurtransferase